MTHQTRMPPLSWVLALLLCCCATTCLGWGRVVNRFSPEVLANFGYSGGNRNYYSPNMMPQTSALRDEAALIEELLEEDEETKAHCRGRRCFSNEQCCDSYLCVEVEDEDTAGSGTCMPKYMRHEGDSCSAAGDCGSTLSCVLQADGQKRCQKQVVGNKAYYEDCKMTTECDVTKGLCCQLLRRHRQTPRKACLYFSDPLMCIGHVPMEEVKAKVEHMASEKRITGHIDDLKHLTN